MRNNKLRAGSRFSLRKRGQRKRLSRRIRRKFAGLDLPPAMELLEDRTLLAAPTPGNILVVRELGFSGPRKIFEYTTSGVEVQEIDLGGTWGSKQLRDLIVGCDGNIHIYDGTFRPTLTTYNVTTGSITETVIPEFSTVNNTTYGGIAAYREFIYLTDMRTGSGGGAKGIVRVDTTDFTWERFPAAGAGHSDLTIGLDGLLYAVHGEGRPDGRISFSIRSRWNTSGRFLPETMVTRLASSLTAMGTFMSPLMG